MTAHVKITENPAVPVTFAVTTSEDTFAFSFVAWEKGDLHVYVDGVELAASGWDVTFTDLQESIPVVGGYGGGTITLVDAVADCTVVIDRLVTFERDTDLPSTGGFNMKSLNSDLDRCTARDQDMKRWLERAITVPLGETGFELDPLADRAGVGPLMFDSAGKFTEFTGTLPGDIAVGPFGEAWAATDDAAEARALLGSWVFCPLNAPYNCAGDEAADDYVGLQACIDDASALGELLQCMVAVDLAWRSYRVVEAPLDHKPWVEIRNGTGMFSTVAARTVGSYTVYCWIVGEGELSSTIGNLSRRGERGTMVAFVDAVGDLAENDLVMTGHAGPITRTTASCNSSALTIPVTSTAGFAASGMIRCTNGEVIAYTSKTATQFNVRAAAGAVPIGRGRNQSSAATISNNTQVVQYNSGQWGIGGTGATPRLPVDVNYVRELRTLSGEYAVLLRHALSRSYSVTAGRASWIKRIDPVRNIGLTNVRLVGSDTQGRPGGLEYGYHYLLCDRMKLSRVTVEKCSDVHGGLDACFNVDIDEATCIGKARGSSYDGHYALLINNACRWVRVRGVSARDCYKVVTVGASQATDSLLNYGFPRDILIDGYSLFNGGEPDDNAHGVLELHSYVEDVTVRNGEGTDAQEGLSIEGGRNITFEGATIRRWARAGMFADGCHNVNGFKVRGIDLGPRSLLAAGTVLDGAITDVATTIKFGSHAWMTDLPNDGSDIMVKIGDELIKLGTSGVDGQTVTGCTRGMYGTTAAAHADGDRVTGAGHAYGVPHEYIFTQAKMFLDDPDAAATYLTSAITDADATIPVNDLSLFADPGAGPPLKAEIEGQVLVSDQYPSEVITYTGKSAATGAGNLTGAVRGACNTVARAHGTNMLMQPFFPALTNIEIEACGELDTLRPMVTVSGYNPSFNTRVSKLDLAYTGALRMNTHAAVFEPGGMIVDGGGGELYATPYGVRTYGPGSRVRNINGRLDAADAVGGELVLLEGERSSAFGIVSDGHYINTRLAGEYCAADGWVAHRFTNGSSVFDDSSGGFGAVGTGADLP